MTSSTYRRTVAWLKKRGYLSTLALEERSNEAPAQTSLEACAELAMRLAGVETRTVDLKNTVIILTSNIGSHHIQAIEDRAGLDDSMRKELIHRAVMEDVHKAFRPEFVNRSDEVVVFSRLERAQIRTIVDVQLARFASRLAKRGLFIDVTDPAKDALAELG